MEEQKPSVAQEDNQNQGQPGISFGTASSTPEAIPAPLDYTKDEAHVAVPCAPFRLEPYDPRPQEDGARRTIAYLLIGLLWLVVAGILILLAFGAINVADLKDFGVIVGPIVALVSAATGFYYGTKSNSA